MLLFLCYRFQKGAPHRSHLSLYSSSKFFENQLNGHITVTITVFQNGIFVFFSKFNPIFSSKDIDFSVFHIIPPAIP